MSDKLIRVLGAENEYIVKALVATELVEKARTRQGCNRVAASCLGEILMGAILMEDSSKNEGETLTLELEGEGIKILASADKKGSVVGRVSDPNMAHEIKRGSLSVIKDQGMRAPYRSTLPLVDEGIAKNLIGYYAYSEQLPTYFSLGVSLNDKGKVECAYGYMVQALPFASKEAKKAIVSNLERMPSKEEILSRKETPERLVSLLLNGLSQTKTEEMPIRFHCSCSKNSGLKLLRGLGANELKQMIEEGKPVEITCGLCGKKYVYPLESIEALLEEPKA